MKKQLLNTILNNIKRLGDKNSFFINNQFYTYSDFSKRIAGINQLLKKQNITTQTAVGVITNDCIETYASIVSLWLNGFIFIPISPSNSKERNENSIIQANIKYLLTANSNDAMIIETNNLTIIETVAATSENKLINNNHLPNNILYILFTSGSTGIPKGVPITLANLESFIYSFINLGYQLDEHDRFLQIYDLSFDASVHCYTLPLFVGGCTYTVPTNEIKYLYAYKLIKEQELTFVKMPPSTITYLQPYFHKINLEKLRYTLFGGEALPLNLAKQWKKCAINSEIHNVYGPTEATINCFYFQITPPIKNVNEIVCIGQPIGDTIVLVLDENQTILAAHQKGELCLSGTQITKGYWKNPQKNKTAFVKIIYHNKQITFYKTGDLVYFDDDNDYYFCGRIDNQVQIQGYRVELGEIEYHARIKTKKNYVVAMSVQKNGIQQLYLFIENYTDSIKELKKFLEDKLPNYMVPQHIINIEQFPVLTSGKIDRNKLKELI